MAAPDGSSTEPRTVPALPPLDWAYVVTGTIKHRTKRNSDLGGLILILLDCEAEVPGGQEKIDGRADRQDQRSNLGYERPGIGRHSDVFRCCSRTEAEP